MDHSNNREVLNINHKSSLKYLWFLGWNETFGAENGALNIYSPSITYHGLETRKYWYLDSNS